MASIEDFRLQFNELSDEIGDFNTGVTNSVPSGAGSSLTAVNAVEQLVDDVNKIIDGTYSFSEKINVNSDEINTEGDSIAIAIALT